MNLRNTFMGQDHFPVGMRVLAVDDNQACLKLLENLLRQCRYHVTTATNSMMALEILRRNTSNFDLVITSVNMPDMDGFQLLKQDLPVVIMLSGGYCDKDLVIKCVTHGACGILLKPLRIEELKNIWQHVVRNKIDCNSAYKEITCNMAGEATHGIILEKNHDQNKILGQKRKEISEDEQKENEEASSGKKPRLVWTADLHTRFVAAVQLLGFDKATPKRIIELMKVEGLTRENVASHKQKFKLTLKKSATRASIGPALGSNLNGCEEFCGLDPVANMPMSGSSSYQQSTTRASISPALGSNLNGCEEFCGLDPVANMPMSGSSSYQQSTTRASIGPALGSNLNGCEEFCGLDPVANLPMSGSSSYQQSTTRASIVPALGSNLNRCEEFCGLDTVANLPMSASSSYQQSTTRASIGPALGSNLNRCEEFCGLDPVANLPMSASSSYQQAIPLFTSSADQSSGSNITSIFDYNGYNASSSTTQLPNCGVDGSLQNARAEMEDQESLLWDPLELIDFTIGDAEILL